MRPNWSVPALRPASEVFKIVCLKGNAFEMGCQHGECLRDEIAYAIHRCIERFALSQQGWHRDTLLAFAQQLAQGLPDAYREELQGISAGSGVSMDDLLLWNFFDDYWEICGCSAFAANGRQPLDVSQCIARLDTPPIRRDGPPDNWTISSAVYEPDGLKTHLAHGFLPASRGAFVEVSLADLAGGPVGLLCQPYSERVTELSREP
jgi:hypothetical protein